MPLLAHYKLNGDCDDAGGNGHHGTPSGESYVAGKIGQAFDCAATRYIDLPAGIVTAFSGKSAAVFAGWIKRTGTSGQQCLFYIANGLYTARFFAYLLGDGRIRVAGRSTPGEPLQDVYTVAALTDATEYHHVAMVEDLANDRIRVYIDGELQETTGSVSFSQTTFSSDSGVARLARTTDGYYALNGLLDDVRFYDAMLTPGQIKAIYNGGDGSEAEVFGPYRREEAQAVCTGAAVGQSYHFGADAGQAQ